MDTSAVVLISHYAAGVLPVRPDEPVAPQLLAFIASGYLFKAVAALADTLPFIWITRALRQWLNIPSTGSEIGGDDDPLMQAMTTGSSLPG